MQWTTACTHVQKYTCIPVSTALIVYIQLHFYTLVNIYILRNHINKLIPLLHGIYRLNSCKTDNNCNRHNNTHG